MTRPTDPARLDHAVTLYMSGQSALQVNAATGVSRGALRRELLSRGVEPRGRSAAALNRASKMTPAERLNQAAAAHEAVRGRKVPHDERCKSALGRQRNPPAMSEPEARFADWLAERHVPYGREVAVGPYNLDFAIGAVGVEILGGEWHADKKARHSRRTPYILSGGWSLCFVWSTINHPMTAAAAEHVIAYANKVSRDPSALGEYRVIRGDGNLIASGRCEDDEFAGIPPARDR